MMVDAESLDAFAAAFATLSALHLEAPGQAALDALRDMAGEWPLAAEGPTGEGLSLWRRSKDVGESAEWIERDHDRLYGDSAVAIVAPYESVHRDVEALVFGRETLQVRAAYAELGLQAPELNREPDDHIGLELEFLGRACLRCLDLGEAGDDAGAGRALETADSFMAEHLGMWASVFLDEVHRRAGTSFMRGLALLTQGALDNFATIINRNDSATT